MSSFETLRGSFTASLDGLEQPSGFMHACTCQSPPSEIQSPKVPSAMNLSCPSKPYHPSIPTNRCLTQLLPNFQIISLSSSAGILAHFISF